MACLGALALGAAPAGATFRGVNGRLATAWLDNDQGAHEEAAYAVVNVPWQHRSAGTNVVSCTNLDGCPVYAHPAYSPDGAKLAYDELPFAPLAGPPARSELILSAPDGSSPVTISDPAGTHNYFEPSFMPSGRRLLFVRAPNAGPEDDPPAHGELVTSDLTGGGIEVVTPVPGADPVVSPNGRRVLFDHAGGIWVVGIGGANPHRLIRSATMPDWSFDGRSIVYASGNYPRGKHTLYVARADGTQPRRVLGAYPHQRRRHPLRYVDYPRFSPDGSQIAFSSSYYDSLGDPYLMRVPAGGGQVKVLWTTPPLDAGGTDYGVSWQPLPVTAGSAARPAPR
jgi:Tol biopolymer transport system component